MHIRPPMTTTPRHDRDQEPTPVQTQVQRRHLHECVSHTSSQLIQHFKPTPTPAWVRRVVGANRTYALASVDHGQEDGTGEAGSVLKSGLSHSPHSFSSDDFVSPPPPSINILTNAMVNRDSSNLTFSLAPGWAFVPSESWRKDRAAEWAFPESKPYSGMLIVTCSLLVYTYVYRYGWMGIHE